MTEILKNQDIKSILLVNPKKYKLFVENTYSQSFCNIDDTWMAALNSKIIDRMSINNPNMVVISNFSNYQKKTKRKKI